MEKIMSKTKNEFGVTSMYITESNRCLTDAELGGVNGGLGNRANAQPEFRQAMGPDGVTKFA
jgi:hypothetical protein